MPLWTLPPNESPRRDWSLRRSIEVAAGACFGRGSDDVVQGMVDLFDGRGHLARTGGLDDYFKAPFVVVGDGPGEVRLG